MRLRMIAACLVAGLGAASAGAAEFTVTVTSGLVDESLAPMVLADVQNDADIFSGQSLTSQAERLLTMGDPSRLIERIGATATVGRGGDGPEGAQLAAGNSFSFVIETSATALRIFVPVAPLLHPDQYLTAVADLHAGPEVTVDLHRYDAGLNEGRRTSQRIGKAVSRVTFTRR